MKKTDNEVVCTFAFDERMLKKLSSHQVLVKVRKSGCGIFDKTLSKYETKLTVLKSKPELVKVMKHPEGEIEHRFKIICSFDDDDAGKTDLNAVMNIEIVASDPPFKTKAGEVVLDTTGDDLDEEETKEPTRVAPKKPASKPGVVEIPEGVGRDEIVNPDVTRNLFSLNYVM